MSMHIILVINNYPSLLIFNLLMINFFNHFFHDILDLLNCPDSHPLKKTMYMCPSLTLCGIDYCSKSSLSLFILRSFVLYLVSLWCKSGTMYHIFSLFWSTAHLTEDILWEDSHNHGCQLKCSINSYHHESFAIINTFMVHVIRPRFFTRHWKPSHVLWLCCAVKGM